MWIFLYELICYNYTESINKEQKDLIEKLSPGIRIHTYVRSFSSN